MSHNPVGSVLLPCVLFCCKIIFFEIYAVLSRFTQFLCGEKLSPKFCSWRKNDKYNVWPSDGQNYITFISRKVLCTGVSASSIHILSHQAVMVNGKKQYFAERSADVEASIKSDGRGIGVVWGQLFEWGADMQKA